MVRGERKYGDAMRERWFGLVKGVTETRRREAYMSSLNFSMS